MSNNCHRRTLFTWITVENCVVTLCFLFFSLAFTIHHSSNAILACLLILGSIQLFLLRKAVTLSKIDPTLLLFLGIFSALPLVVVLQVLCFPQVGVEQLDAPLKFLGGGLLLFLFKTINPRKLALSGYGCIIGTYGMALWGWLSTHCSAYAFTPTFERGSNNFINPIEFGCFAILLGCVSLALPLPTTRTTCLRVFFSSLKITGFIASLIAATYSGTRAAFVALPILLWLPFTHKCQRPRLSVTLGVLCLMGFAMVGLLTQTRLLNRVLAGVHDLALYSTSKDTSIGARFQMWRIAGSTFIDHPALGIGHGGYAALLRSGKYQREDSTFLLRSNFRHAHNEYLNAAAEMGILGLTATLLILLAPGLFFYKHRRSTLATPHFAANAGLMVVIGHATFCLFDTLFLISCQVTGYSLPTGLLIALIVNEHTPATNKSTAAYKVTELSG